MRRHQQNNAGLVPSVPGDMWHALAFLHGITSIPSATSYPSTAPTPSSPSPGPATSASPREWSCPAFTDQRWEETTARGGGWTAGGLTVCGICHTDDLVREEAARLQTAAVPPPPDTDQEPDRPSRCLFRRRS
ncbi:hypothetical protein ACWCQL_22005 [Streptomyces sp. NPDC002073]